jgi:hypothetical protein
MPGLKPRAGCKLVWNWPACAWQTSPRWTWPLQSWLAQQHFELEEDDLLLSRDDGQSFVRQTALPPKPSAALVEADAGHVILAGLRGLQRQALNFT